MSLQSQIARIKKAIELIKSGTVTPMADGRYSVRTERMNVQYTVTMTTCDCYDSQDAGNICKHRWAVIAGVAAMLISELHSAASVADLESIDRKYTDAMKHASDVFKRIARDEYKARHAALIGNAGAMLVKSQPKSNGRYDGIEI